VEPVTESGCWIWTGPVNVSGYGRFNWGRTRGGRCIVKAAHRFSFEIANGPITEGKIILHSCDLPCCVNPDHLREGTYQDNANDMVSRGRHGNNLGTNNWNAKLSPEKVLKMREKIALSPLPLAVICEQVGKENGVSVTTVLSMWTRKTWKHVECPKVSFP